MGLSIGQLHVRRSILINASPHGVWEHFSSFEAISGWLDQGHRLHSLEPTVGGTVELSVEIDGERSYYGGAVLVYDPGQELSFESQWAGSRAWPVPTFWTFRLISVYDATLVEFLHHGFERLGADAADNLEGYEEGWDITHLASLRALVEQ